MDYILNESQLKFIVEDQRKNFVEDNIVRLFEFTSDLLKNAKEKFGANLGFLITWGASVGGVVVPLDNYIRTNHLNITDDQITLILIGCIANLIINNQELFDKIYNQCKKEGIEKILLNTLSKGSKLKNSFKTFLKSFDFSINSNAAFLSYAFLLPIIGDIQSMAKGDEDVAFLSARIVERIMASGLVTLSAHVLDKLVKKIIGKSQ